MIIPPPAHKIRRAVFNFEYSDEKIAFEARQRLESLIETAILPALQAVFDTFAPEDGIHRIEHLEIDLGQFRLDDLDTERLQQKVRQAAGRVLEQLIGRIEPSAEAANRPRQAGSRVEAAHTFSSLTGSQLAETLAVFLETGSLAWDAPVESLAALERELLQVDLAFAPELHARLRRLPAAESIRRRLSRQFSPAFIEWLARRLYVERWDEVIQLVEAVGEPLHARQRSAAVLAALQILAETPEAPTESVAEAVYREVQTTADLDLLPVKEAALDGTALETHIQPEMAPHYVRLAGVTLLHPFLSRFFTAADLPLGPAGRGLQGDGSAQVLSSIAARERAVHLLYYLATGMEQPEEPHTTFLKLLAGLPLQWPLPRAIELTQHEKDEAENLLRAAIGHWNKLGRTSPSGLREGFLQRDGRLVSEQNGWRLTVERRAIDLLLDYLPWSLTPGRLPWMTAPLWVDWV